MECLREKGSLGEATGYSFSRCLPALLIGLLTAAWIAVGAWIFAASQDAAVWERAGGWLSWGRDLAFVSVIPYVGNRISRIRGGS